MSVFQRFKFGSKIVKILQKCCWSVDFFQEIALNQLELFKFLYLNLGTVSFTYNSFKQIYRDSGLNSNFKLTRLAFDVRQNFEAVPRE